MSNISTIIIASIVAAIPIAVWVGIFYKIKPERKQFLILAFVAGCFSPVIILLYQQLWGATVNVIFFEITPVNFKQSLSEYSTDHFLQQFLVFVFGVGMMEEFIKHFVVRKNKPVEVVLLSVVLLFSATIYILYKIFTWTWTITPIIYLLACWTTFYIFVAFQKRIKFMSIDQVILAAIMSGLGFAFIENIIYLLRVLSASGGDIAMAGSVLFGRSLFVVMVHVFCSGIFGYYYGIAQFAGPYLKKQEVEGKKFFLVEILQRILRFSKSTIFEEKKMLEGLMISMLLHGLYDFILGVNLNLSDVLGFVGISNGPRFPLFAPIMVLYLIGGFWYLKMLLEEKKNHLKFGLVGTEAMPEQDFNELIGKIKKIGKQRTGEQKLIESKYVTPDELKEMQSMVKYLKKFNLLKEKYVGTEWMSEQEWSDLTEQIKKVKASREQNKS